MRILLVSSLMFFFGFFVHALFFPNNFTNISISPEKLLQPEKTNGTPYKSNAFTEVAYKNGSFQPSRVAIINGNNVLITNMDDKENMWLVSDNKILTTSRPFGKSEQFKAFLSVPGSYTVLDKLHPSAQLVVVVQ
jgi:plastocyanin